MLRPEGRRRRCRLAPWVTGGSLFLLLMLFPASEMPPYFCCREGPVQFCEQSAVQLLSGAPWNPVGALVTGASSDDEDTERRMQQLDTMTKDVCVDRGTDYRDVFLTSLNLAAVPSTPEGTTPPMQHGIARAMQLQRWRLLHQTAFVGFSLLYGITKPESLRYPEYGGSEGGYRRRLAARAPPALGGTSYFVDDDNDGIYTAHPAPHSGSAAQSPGRGPGTGGGRGPHGERPRQRDPDPAKDPDLTPPVPPGSPLRWQDALFHYLSLVSGYVTLIALGLVLLVLAIPLSMILVCTPGSLWKSTGGFVNLLCFAAPSFPADAPSGVEPGTESHGKTLDSQAAEAGRPVQGGVGSEGKLGKNLSILSEEAVTQSGAELKTTEGNGDQTQGQHISNERCSMDALATEGIAKSDRTVDTTYAWTGQNVGLLLLVVLLFAVLVCVSLGFGYTAQLNQTLSALQCAFTATLTQVFNGAGSGRESVDKVLQWSLRNLPLPDDPRDEGDYEPGSNEYITAIRNLFNAGGMPEGRKEELTQRFNGEGIRIRNGQDPGGHGRRLTAVEPSDFFSSSRRRRLAAVGAAENVSDDEVGGKAEEAAKNEAVGLLRNSVGAGQTPEGTAADESAAPFQAPPAFVSKMYGVIGGNDTHGARKEESDARHPSAGLAHVDTTDGHATDGVDGSGRATAAIVQPSNAASSGIEPENTGDEGVEPRGPSRGSTRQTDFGGILPMLTLLKRVRKMTDSDSPQALSTIAAKVLAKGLTVDHLVLSLYDHFTALEEVIDTLPNARLPHIGFGHFSLAQVTVLPFLRVINDMMPTFRNTLRQGHHQAHEAIYSTVLTENRLRDGMQAVDPVVDKVDRGAEQVKQVLQVASRVQNQAVLPALYVFGAFLTFLLVGSIFYLMYLNRQPVTFWESGKISPGPSAWLWWLLLVIGGITFVLGAALVTVSVVAMDGCIFAASTVQDPSVLKQLSEDLRWSGSGAFKVDSLISSCIGRTPNRDLSTVLEISGSTGDEPVLLADLRKEVSTRLEEVRTTLQELLANDFVSDTITILTSVLDLAHQHAGIYIFRDDVRSHLERAAPAAHYSGMQDETIEFTSVFNLPRAELIGPEDVTRDGLLPLPPHAPTTADLLRFYREMRPTPLTDDVLLVLQEHAPLHDRMKAAVRLLGENSVKGHYRLYGMRDMQQVIHPLWFGAFIADQDRRANLLLMVDNNSQEARAYTQTLLGRMPPNERYRIGEALELARRKAGVRPGQTFSCLRRVGYTTNDLRHTDKHRVGQLIRTFKTSHPSHADYELPEWDEATQMFRVTRYRQVKHREEFRCTYEEQAAQIRSEAEQAVFSLALIHGRSQKALNELKSTVFRRVEALEHYADVAARSLDCTPVYRSVLTTQQVLCRDTTERVTLLGITWLFTSLLAIALFTIFFCIWQYLTERYFRRREAEKAELEARRAAEKAAEDARRAEEERIAKEEAAAAAAAASAARAEARARQVSAAALNRQRTSVQRAQSTASSRLQIHSGSFAAGGGAREMLAARDQADSVEDTMWADTAFD